MSDQTPPNMGNLPQWLNLFIAGLTGAIISTAALVKWSWNLNSRIQRLENQDLEKIIKAHISADRHDNLYPMLQTRVFAILDKIEDEQRLQGQNIAVLLERDRTGAALEKIAASISAR